MTREQMAPEISSDESGVVGVSGVFMGMSGLNSGARLCGEMVELGQHGLEVGRLKFLPGAAGDDREAMAVLADGAVNKIVLIHPANEPGRETVGVQDLKRVGEGAAGLLERDRVVLGGGTAGQGFAVGTADAAGENAGDLHLVRQPVVELLDRKSVV